jgi:hypothetical protein
MDYGTSSMVKNEMNYDSEEERKLQERLAEKLKETKEFLSDKNKIKHLVDSFHQVMELLEPLTAKIKAGQELTEDEVKRFIYIRNSMDQARQTFEDMKLILGQNSIIQADAVFFEIKKLAEEGNQDAQSAYEKLLPSFKRAHGTDSPDKLN